MIFQPVLYVIGYLLSALSIVLCIPAIVDAYYGDNQWQSFTFASLISLFVGILLILGNKSDNFNISLKQAFLITTTSWISIAIFGSLPFIFSDLGLSFTDAFFESMSGITTTGSTILSGLDNLPHGILIWRALLQWIGGIGIIVIAIAFLPILKVGGMQLFHTESSESSEKVLPRAAQIASIIGIIYLFLTILCSGLLYFFGMPVFDSIAHSMTTLATGGFSTSDMSIGKYDNVNIELIISLFMILGSLPFVLYLQTLRGNFFVIFKDSQVQFFLFLIVTSILIVTFWKYQDASNFFDNFRSSFFNTISIFTGTGYTTQNFNNWGSFIIVLFLFLMLVGGCAGSTTCGIKIFRLQILYQSAKIQLFKLMNPHGVSIAKYNKKPVSNEIISSVMGYFFMFIISYIIITLILSFLGNDFLTSLSGAATSLANVGPGLGNVIGPTKTFADLSEITKWVLIAGMLIGRLELLAVIIILTPSFWKN
ncbi:MAG: Trk system potassium uptake protein TrkI [Alphaproteobacteria bacterium MarineAlpha6_Bin6]|nr:potassium transporter TrkH [Pelagibacteraceae bacterium]PPR32273.1 MAG: Trk system potassium uptake protein TrkI [Alphaproteobacteria bacterium MarineAlpha6_Bin6]PPR34031.1 MAG: Trk system potassium uptake protein TrkI [Alphaproteobacteria bacterium MarineAlpha6_Bin5]|tara:strand:- start:16692 stop:18134 length:1443 start_codon:yes stop_codon:yes gene_type:complete